MKTHTFKPVPILITGAHRSGTTWVGKMLASDVDTAYISEPLNVLHRPGVFSAQVKHWYQYICDENEQEFLSAFDQLLDYDYHLLAEMRSIRSRKDFLRMGRDFIVFYNALERGQRTLIKDPFAVFSIPWLAKRWNFKVVITVRHPAAFASSLQRLGWIFNFKDLLDQPLLMRDHLESYREQMLSIDTQDVIGQASLLWKMIYGAVHTFNHTNRECLLIKHEEYSRDPVNKFRELYSKLGLTFSQRVEKYILKSSNSDNPRELSSNKTHSVKMNSAASIKNWRKRLSEDEIKRIRTMTQEVAGLYYSDEEWK